MASKHYLRFIIYAGLCGGFTGCENGTFPIVGLDNNGKAIEAYIDQHEYENKLQEILISTHQSVIPVLDERSQDNRKWELQLAVVGFGIRGTAGFGPFQVGGNAGLRAFFTNQPNPPPLP